MRLAIAAAFVMAGGSALAGPKSSAERGVAPTQVRVKLDGPIATITAKLVISADADVYGESFTDVILPAMGLVTSATVTANGAPHPLSMLDAEEASTKFNALAVEG